jgi:hypothetical protein
MYELAQRDAKVMVHLSFLVPKQLRQAFGETL